MSYMPRSGYRGLSGGALGELQALAAFSCRSSNAKARRSLNAARVSSIVASAESEMCSSSWATSIN